MSSQKIFLTDLLRLLRYDFSWTPLMDSEKKELRLKVEGRMVVGELCWILYKQDHFWMRGTKCFGWIIVTSGGGHK